MATIDSKSAAPPVEYQIKIRAFAARLTAGIVLANVIVLGLVILVVSQLRHDREERAKVAAHTISQLLERDIAAVLDKIDSTLLTVADETERQFRNGGIDKQAMHTFMTRQHLRISESDNLLMADAQGDVVLSANVMNSKKHSVADRDYFTVCRNNPTTGLYISKPVMSRLSTTWVVAAARRINRPDGSFEGVVWATVPLDYFSKLFASLDIGPNGAISLRDAEMGIIARYPAPGGMGALIGNKTMSPELRALYEAGQTEGTYLATKIYDKIARIVSYHKIGRYPLFINVGIATDDYLAGWRHDTGKIAALSVCYLIVTLILSWALFARYKREKLAEQSCAESELRFRSMADSAPVLIWVSGVDKLCTWFNNVWLDFTGKTMDEEAGNGWAVGVHPDDLARCLETYVSAFDARKPFRMEYRLRRADGEFRWVLDHGVPRYDDSGNFAGYIGSCIDISDSKAYQSQLKSLASELSLAGERERRHIAVDLHDYVVQDLAFARIRLNLIQRSAASADVQNVSDIIDGTIGKLRNLLFDLSSTALYELGIVAALEGLGERLGKEYGFSFIITVHHELAPVVEKTRIILYQIARELLLNAAKHSRADRVTLTLSQDMRMIRLSVEDNGSGFDVESKILGATAQNNFGLFSIRQRLNHLGGTFEIISANDGGTRAELAIPYLIATIPAEEEQL